MTPSETMTIKEFFIKVSSSPKQNCRHIVCRLCPFNCKTKYAIFHYDITLGFPNMNIKEFLKKYPFLLFHLEDKVFNE